MPLPRPLHRGDRPSLTAQATTLARALELDRAEPIVTDRFAPAFLTGTGRRALAAARAGRPAVTLAEHTRALGIATAALCRHRFIDLYLLEALPEIAQVVILGAGYDSRAYRFASAIGSRPVIEVDLPPLSRAKRALVAEHPDIFRRGRAVSVEIDFRTQALDDRLATGGFVAGVPTFVVWEGVSMYLSPEALRATLRTLGELCGTGSVLTMDFWQHTGGFRPSAVLRRAGELSVGLIGEPLTCAVPSHRAGEVLGEAGFDVVDLATNDVMTERYSTGGRRCDEALYVVAARL